MKHDITEWAEVFTDTQIEMDTGHFHMLATHDCNVFAMNYGADILIGSGKEVRRQMSGPQIYVIEGPSDARIFMHMPDEKALHCVGEVFTNIDRQPMESGNLYEVRKAHRLMQIQSAQMMEGMRKEHRKMIAQTKSITPPAHSLADEVPEELTEEATPIEEKQEPKQKTPKQTE